MGVEFFGFSYLQTSMYRTRWVCYTDSGEMDSHRKSPGYAVLQAQAHSEYTAGDRVKGMDWSVAAVEEELAADDVGVQCSRVEVVGDGAEVEDPAARGGDDAA
jgi:hypothetical protein